MHIAVIGSGISGLSAAWLLSKKHKVDLFEKDDRLGGHANTQDVMINGQSISVDTGFIVYNEVTYPNLIALFDHLNIASYATDMSFSVSINGGEHEYAGSNLASLFAQSSNLFRPSFLRMLMDIRRFYAEARIDAADPKNNSLTLGAYMREKKYGRSFIKDHLLPMGAAIWSMPAEKMLKFPFTSFIRFCDNHGLLQIKNRPKWRTVKDGSRQYVNQLAKRISGSITLNSKIELMERTPSGVTLHFRDGESRNYDHVVLACHSDQALRLLKTHPNSMDQREKDILANIRYQNNVAILHRDKSLMPKRKKAWAAWNYLKKEDEDASKLCVSYWMNRLQDLPTDEDIFVTLNPIQQPNQGDILRTYLYSHPVFDAQAMQAQRDLWSLQGQNRTWYCGAYLGHGFHEDGLQAGLAVAERLGDVTRPWSLDNPSSRMHFPPSWNKIQSEAAQ